MMLAVGVYYLIRLFTLGSDGAKFGMTPEVLNEWKAKKRSQYIWGIIAGWGSAIAYFVYLFLLDPCFRGYCSRGDLASSTLVGLFLTVVILIIGIVLSVRGGRAAKRLQSTGQAAWGQPGAYPQGPAPAGWGQPAQPGSYPQGPAPAGWGQPAQPGSYPQGPAPETVIQPAPIDPTDPSSGQA
jgi:hypothetical protein